MCDLMFPGPNTMTMRDRVLLIIRLSPDGCTASEIAEKLGGKSKFSIRPRITELLSEAKIKDSGRWRYAGGACGTVWIAIKPENA